MSVLAFHPGNSRKTHNELTAPIDKLAGTQVILRRASTHQFSKHPAWITELDATRQISQAASLTTELREGVETVVGIALHTLGVLKIELIPREPLLAQIPKPLSFGSAAATEPPGVAFAEIVAEGKRWGELRVFFELHPLTIENPLRFAKYLGQQLGALLVRMELALQRDSLRRKAARFRTLLAQRKAIHRAKALLRHAHNVSEDEALSLMRRYVEQTGRTMHQIAEAIVFSDRQKWSQAREVPIASPSTHRKVARSRP